MDDINHSPKEKPESKKKDLSVKDLTILSSLKRTGSGIARRVFEALFNIRFENTEWACEKTVDDVIALLDSRRDEFLALLLEYQIAYMRENEPEAKDTDEMAEHCVISSIALGIGLQKWAGNPFFAEVVYGHYILQKGHPFHFWTEMFIQGEKYILCMTYGQFDNTYRGKMLFDRADNLREKYGLRRFERFMPSDADDRKMLQFLSSQKNLLQRSGLPEIWVQRCQRLSEVISRS